jgi:4-amino-4-deoxychorismate lyase
VESVEAAPYQAKKPRTLELVLADRIDYGHKYLDRMALNDLKAKSQADDIIMVQEGLVTDSTIANLVFENKDGLFTPLKCLLPGVKREALLKSGQILPKTIKVTDLSQYSKVFLINAMIDLEDEVCVSNENIIPGEL